jgi:formylglycine-generating enzyme required for sulfatase activity
VAEYRIFWGGSCYDEARYLRSANRNYHAPEYRYHSVGFRVALGSSVR